MTLRSRLRIGMIDISEIGTIKLKSKNRSHNYAEIKYDIEGWAKTSDWKPATFDMCLLRNAQGRIKVGWWSGTCWDGLHVKENEELTHWKRKKD